MSHSHSSRPAYLRVVTPEPASAAASDWPPLPVMVPLLHPDQGVTPTQEALVTMLAQRARQGDQAAVQLLWRAFEARLEPVLRSSTRATRQNGEPHRDGQPWMQEDLRQEAFVVFSDLTATWEGTESYVPYITAHFAWRLRMAARRLGPQRPTAPHAATARPASDVPRDARGRVPHAAGDRCGPPVTGRRHGPGSAGTGRARTGGDCPSTGRAPAHDHSPLAADLCRSPGRPVRAGFHQVTATTNPPVLLQRRRRGAGQSGRPAPAAFLWAGRMARQQEPAACLRQSRAGR